MYLLVPSLGRVAVVPCLRPALRPPLQLPVLDLDLPAAGAVRGVAQAPDLGAHLLQVGRVGHAHLHLVHRDCESDKETFLKKSECWHKIFMLFLILEPQTRR